MYSLSKKKATWVAIVVLLLLVLIGSLYVERYGNPIEVARTRGLIEQYLRERYPDTQFAYVETFFHMKFDTYGGRVVSQGPIPVEFTVERWKQGRFYDDYLSQKLSAEGKVLVEPLVQAVLPTAMTEIWVSVSSLDSRPENLTFSEVLDLAGVGITWNNSSSTEESFVDAALQVRDRLKDAGIAIPHCKFCCRLEGTAAWSLSLDEDEINLTKEAILASHKVNRWS